MILPVKTMPTNMKRQPKTGRATWQFAATTTPATTKPPSIFSTRSLEMGAGHASPLPFSRPGSGDLQQKEKSIKRKSTLTFGKSQLVRCAIWDSRARPKLFCIFQFACHNSLNHVNCIGARHVSSRTNWEESFIIFLCYFRDEGSWMGKQTGRHWSHGDYFLHEEWFISFFDLFACFSHFIRSESRYDKSDIRLHCHFQTSLLQITFISYT